MAWSKEKRAAYMKRYRKEHKEEIRLKKKLWDMKNQERLNRYNQKYVMRWREANREQYLAYQKKYREMQKLKALRGQI